MAASPMSPTYTPVNSINWELRERAKHVGKENHRREKTVAAGALGPRIKQCRDEMREIVDLVSEHHKERTQISDQLLAAQKKAANDRRRIEELESLVGTQTCRDTMGKSAAPSPSLVVSPQAWEMEKEDLFVQLGDLKREKARQAEEFSRIQTRLEAKTDELHRQAEMQAQEIQRLKGLAEQSAQKEMMHTRRIENMQRLQRKATKDRNDVLETLETGLDEARSEAEACKRQMEEVLTETKKQIAAAEVRGRDAQLKELRALSPRAMLSFLAYPQQQRQNSVWGWLGSA